MQQFRFTIKWSDIITLINSIKQHIKKRICLWMFLIFGEFPKNKYEPNVVKQFTHTFTKHSEEKRTENEVVNE